MKWSSHEVAFLESKLKINFYLDSGAAENKKDSNQSLREKRHGNVKSCTISIQEGKKSTPDVVNLPNLGMFGSISSISNDALSTREVYISRN